MCLQTFMDHFKQPSQKKPQDTCGPCEETESTIPTVEYNESLSIDFSLFEIKEIISKLKNNKACGIDFIRNEFLKRAPHELLNFVFNFFNLILQTGVVPDLWCQGLIMPLYKNKGSRYDPNNHRGITLLSCLRKLLTACLNARIFKFMYGNEIIGFEQAGFRPEFSTMDHIFTLHAVIEYYKCKKGRVYCAFIDYSKAFDLIVRASSSVKLLNHGVNGKIISEKYDTFHFKWVETVKSTLNNTGFSTIWENQYIDVAKFKSCFVQRCKDIFQQNWLEEVSNNSQCTSYREVKDSFNMEDYLVNLESCHKYNLIKFRTRTHHLPITKQRFHDTSADIACPFCSSNEVGDEFHYLFVCDFFKVQRDKCIAVGLLRLPHTIMFKHLFTRS